MMVCYLIYYWVVRCSIVKVIWKGFWKVAITQLINDRGKETAVSGSCTVGL